MSHQSKNLFAGRQIVSVVEIWGANNSLVRPRGAVCVGTSASLPSALPMPSTTSKTLPVVCRRISVQRADRKLWDKLESWTFYQKGLGGGGGELRCPDADGQDCFLAWWKECEEELAPNQKSLGAT
jgi:hypothetical protein